MKLTGRGRRFATTTHSHPVPGMGLPTLPRPCSLCVTLDGTMEVNLRALRGWAAGVLVILACDTATAPKATLQYKFGRVTALLDERPWQSSYFPDSLVGFYDTTTARLQIIGQEIRKTGLWPTLLIVIPAGATATAYPLTPDPSGRIAIWTPALHESYISAGSSVDSLWVEQLNLEARTVRGSFKFLGAPLYTQTSVYVVGRFEGTLRLTGGL